MMDINNRLIRKRQDLTNAFFLLWSPIVSNQNFIRPTIAIKKTTTYKISIAYYTNLVPNCNISQLFFT